MRPRSASAQSGWRPKGTLKVISVVDEETGGAEGARWLCDNRPELAHADFLLNEGGGAVFPFDGRRVYDVGIAEKGVFRFRLIAEGVAGHASMPKIGDNALLKLAPLLQAMIASPLMRPDSRAAGDARGPRRRPRRRRSDPPRSPASPTRSRSSR